MADIKKLFKQYQSLQHCVSAEKDSIDKKRNRLDLKERGLDQIARDLKNALYSEVKELRERATKAGELLSQDNFPEVYKLLTGEALTEAVRHVLMPQTGTYAKGVQALRDSYKRGECPTHPLFTQDNGSKIVRPLTFKEDIEARVNDYETLKNPDGSERTKEERLNLFSRWLDSCTGIANRKKSTKFKIVPVCKELILIDKDFNEYSMSVNYDSIEGVELDSKKGKYNQPLPKLKVLEQPGWRAAAEEDLDLLKTFRDIVSSARGNSNELMGFYIREKTNSDQLRGLCVDDLGGDSNADSYFNLNDVGSFLRVAQ